MLNVKGVKIGIVAYTYETPFIDGFRTMNTRPFSEEAKSLINSYNPEEEADNEGIIKSIDGAKQDGAEIVICYFHWGKEYVRSQNKVQRETAQIAADNGADIIFASHPHVLQPMEMIDTTDKQVPVFWSMGNYISNQRAETTHNRHTEQSIIAQINLTYNARESSISQLEMTYVPLWIDKYDDGSRSIFSTIPLVPGFEENPTLRASGHVDRAMEALTEITALLGEAQGWEYNR